MDAKTLSYINLRAILGSIPRLCEMVPEAQKLIAGKDVSIGFDVKGGPAGTLVFKDGKCCFVDGVDNCDVKLPFSSPEKFRINGLRFAVASVPRKQGRLCKLRAYGLFA